MAASMTCPLPEFLVSKRAATIPKANNIPPPPKSPIRFKGGTGGESSLPIAAKAPDKAI